MATTFSTNQLQSTNMLFEQEFAMAIEREQNPSVPVPNHQIDDMMDKLKMLNYEKLLLKGLKLKPPSRRYFQRGRSAEQFYLFTSLCAWLARNLGKDFDQPQEFDDPSATIAKIIRLLQSLVNVFPNLLSLNLIPHPSPSTGDSLWFPIE